MLLELELVDAGALEVQAYQAGIDVEQVGVGQGALQPAERVAQVAPGSRLRLFFPKEGQQVVSAGKAALGRQVIEQGTRQAARYLEYLPHKPRFRWAEQQDLQVRHRY